MGKARSGRQNVCILTETNGIVEDRLETEPLYAIRPDSVEAWVLDTTQQAIDEDTGEVFQTLCERSCWPLVVFDLDRTKESSGIYGGNVTTIASQKEDEEIAFMEKKRGKTHMLLWLGIIATIFALTISLLVLKSL